MPQPRWVLLPPAPPAYRAWLPHVPEPIVHVLYHRAAEPEAALAFLSPERATGDPFLLPDMEVAVARLLRAVERGETIALYGDYDVDGVTGTALLAQALRALGVPVVPYIPHRIDDGYGLTRAALQGLRERGASLVVCIDTGITAVEEIAFAEGLGLEVIVTDHHRVPAALPAAVAAINPRRPDSRYPFRELAGVGVAFKLLEGLGMALGGRLANRLPLLEEGLDLVALGTVADLAPLVGENRWLVACGLERLRAPTGVRLGLQALMERARIGREALTAESIAYGLAPRLNAAGRLDHASLSFRLLTTEEAEEARALAERLEELNAERQRLTRELVEEARRQVEGQVGAPVLWVEGPRFLPGVLGLIAARLVEEHGRPAVAVATAGPVATASLRSPGVDLVPALEACSELLVRFGGHTQAAGFSAEVARLPEVRRRLLRWVGERWDGLEEGWPVLQIDAEVPLDGWSGESVRWLQALEPYGAGNPGPLFLARGLELVEAQPVGAGQEHLRLRVRRGQRSWSLIGFGLGPRLAELPSWVDIVYYWNLEMPREGGQPLLGLAVRDIAPAGAR